MQKSQDSITGRVVFSVVVSFIIGVILGDNAVVNTPAYVIGLNGLILKAECESNILRTEHCTLIAVKIVDKKQTEANK